MFKETSTGTRKELNFLNVAGVFLVLAVGTALSILAAVLEYVFIRRKAKKKLKVGWFCGQFNGISICFTPESWTFTQVSHFTHIRKFAKAYH